MTLGAICGPPSSVYRVIKSEPDERWCFAERKRRTGVWECVAPDTEWVIQTMAYGWAEPFWQYRCDGCGRDAHEFGSGW